MPDRKPVTILLDELAEAMDRSTEDPMEALLDRETGEVVWAPDADLAGDVDPDLQRLLEDCPERFLPVPRIESRDEHDWMATFTDAVEREDDARRRLADALSGKGAFGRFRNVLRDYPDLRDQWFAARAERLFAAAKQWLEDEGIAFVGQRRRPAPAVLPQPPKKTLPLRIAHVLSLGAGDASVASGKVRRIVKTGTHAPRELFKILARELCATCGVDWRNRFIDGKTSFELEGTRISIDGDTLAVEVEVPDEVATLFVSRPRST